MSAPTYACGSSLKIGHVDISFGSTAGDLIGDVVDTGGRISYVGIIASWLIMS